MSRQGDIKRAASHAELTYRVLARVRDERRAGITGYEEVDTHTSRSRTESALREWFHENEPASGTYRIEHGDLFHEEYWPGPEAVAA